MNVNSLDLENGSIAEMLNVELLSETELREIEGGAILQAAVMLCGAAGGACILGVIIGVAIYAAVN